MAPAIRVSRLIKITFGLVLAGVILIGVLDIVGAVTRLEDRADIVDFHAFYLAGRLALEGRFADAYHTTAMLALEQAYGGRPVFMPWSYPPLFGLVVGGLAALPLGVAYLVFTGGTLSLYLWGTRRLDPEGRWPVMLASAVGIVLNLRCGQNGLLTAGLVAAACAALLRGRGIGAGLGLGLMALKPHLVPLVPIVLCVQRRWIALAVAAASAVALTAISIAVFGSVIVGAFLGALPDVGTLMAAGAYPLHRMTSIFAFCIGIGVAPAAAALIHGAVAACLVGSVARLAVRSADPRLGLGLAVMAGLFVSPYVYDYDQVLFGVGLMLVLPALRRCISARRHHAILVGCAVGQSLGLLMNIVVERHREIIFSPMGPAMLTVFCAVLAPLWRADAAGGRETAPALAA